MIKGLGPATDLSEFTPVSANDPALMQHLRENYELTRPRDYTPEEYAEISTKGMPQGKDTIYGVNAVGLAEGKRKTAQQEHDAKANSFQQMIRLGGIQVHRHNQTGEYGYTKTDDYDKVLRQVNAPTRNIGISGGRQFADSTSEVSTGNRPFNRDGSARMVPASLTYGLGDDFRGFAPVNPLAKVLTEDGGWERYQAKAAEAAAKRRAEWEKAKAEGRVFGAAEFPGWFPIDETGPVGGPLPEGEKGFAPHAAQRPLTTDYRTGANDPGTIDVGSRPVQEPDEDTQSVLDPDIVKVSEIGGPSDLSSRPGTGVPTGGAGIFTPGGPGLYDITKKRAEGVRSAARKMRRGMQQVTERPAAAAEVAAEINASNSAKEARKIEKQADYLENAQGVFNAKLAAEQIKHVFDPNKPEHGHSFFDISEGDDEESPMIAHMSHAAWMNKDWGGREAGDVGIPQTDASGNVTTTKSEAERVDPNDMFNSIGSYREGVKLIQKHIKETHGVDVPVKHMMSWFRSKGVLTNIGAPKIQAKDPNTGFGLFHGCTNTSCKNYSAKTDTIDTNKICPNCSTVKNRVMVDAPTGPTSLNGPKGNSGGGAMWPARAIDATVNLIRQIKNSQQDINLKANPNKGRQSDTVVPKEPVIIYGPETVQAKDASGAALYKPCDNKRGDSNFNSGNACSVATAQIKGKQKAQVNSEKVCPGCSKPKAPLMVQTGRMVRQSVRPEGGQSAVELKKGWQRFSLQDLADHSVQLTNEALSQKAANIARGRAQAAETRRRGGRLRVGEMDGARAAVEAARAAAATAKPVIAPGGTEGPTHDNPQGHTFNRDKSHSKRCTACRVDAKAQAEAAAKEAELAGNLEGHTRSTEGSAAGTLTSFPAFSSGVANPTYESMAKEAEALKAEGHTIKISEPGKFVGKDFENEKTTSKFDKLSGNPYHDPDNCSKCKHDTIYVQRADHKPTSCKFCKADAAKNNFEPTEEPEY